jgi:hypothetical protein
LQAESLTDKKTWSIKLHEDRVEFQPEEGESSDIYRNGVVEKVHVPGLMLAPRTLLFEVSERVLLKFEEAPFAELWEWFGETRVGLLRTALKERFKWSFPIGVVIALLHLPHEGSSAIELIHFGLGAALVVSAIGSTARAWRGFFLVDSAWFVVLAALTVHDIIRGASPWWLLMVLLQIGMVVGGLNVHRLFCNIHHSHTP